MKVVAGEELKHGDAVTTTDGVATKATAQFVNEEKTITVSLAEWNRTTAKLASLEAAITLAAHRLRYLADSVPPDELACELHAVARNLEDQL